MDGVFNSLTIVGVGAGIGVLYGMFGVGSAFATPVLSLLGASSMAAVVGPLPALLPGAAAGAWSYGRRGNIDWSVARMALAGALPAAILGALASRFVGGTLLLLLSGVVLLCAGVRVVRPPRTVPDPERLQARRNSPWFVLGAAGGVGLASGLLANGGGFLLVPLFLVVLGLDIHEAAGTSLLVAAAVTVPTIATHALMGNLDWLLSSRLALGLVPGAVVGAWLAHRLPTARLRAGFGFVLIGFASWFLLRQGLALHV